MVTSNASVWRGSSTRRPAPRASCSASAAAFERRVVVPDLGRPRSRRRRRCRRPRSPRRPGRRAERRRCTCSGRRCRRAAARGRDRRARRRSGTARARATSAAPSASASTSVRSTPSTMRLDDRERARRWRGPGGEPAHEPTDARLDLAGHGGRIAPRPPRRRAHASKNSSLAEQARQLRLSPSVARGEVRARPGRPSSVSGPAGNSPTASGFSIVERRHGRDQLGPAGVVDDDRPR